MTNLDEPVFDVGLYSNDGEDFVNPEQLMTSEATWISPLRA